MLSNLSCLVLFRQSSVRDDKSKSRDALACDHPSSVPKPQYTIMIQQMLLQSRGACPAEYNVAEPIQACSNTLVA